MNRLTLLLNTAILVVTFVVALTAGDVQGRLLTSATRTAGREGRGRDPGPDASLAVIRVVQSMGNFYPASAENTLTTRHIESIRDAIEIYGTATRSGLDAVMAENADAEDVRHALDGLGKGVRLEIEAALGESFDNPSTVRRLATEVIRSLQ